MTHRPDPRDVAAVVLARAALVDKTTPKPDPNVLDMWAECLARAPFVVTLEAASNAVAEHYAEADRSVMPADVIARARKFAPRSDGPRLQLLPSGWESDADRDRRLAAGAAQARRALAEAKARRTKAITATETTDIAAGGQS